MSSAAFGHDDLLPRPPGGMAPGAVLALLAHAGLVAALAVGVDWRTQPAEVVAAELWASVPQVAAPRPAPPPPPVPRPAPEPPSPPPPAPAPAPAAAQAPDAQIAVEQERRRQAQAEREERAAAARRQQAQAAADRREREARLKAEAQAQAEAERRAEAAREAQAARERAAEEARLARQREENLARMLGQAGGATGSGAANARGTAARDAAPSAAYAGRLVASIKPNIVFTERVAGNPAAEVEVRAAPSGSVIARRLIKSSGHREWDEAVLRAIDRTGSLPRDTDGRVPPVITITFRPND